MIMDVILFIIVFLQFEGEEKSVREVKKSLKGCLAMLILIKGV